MTLEEFFGLIERIPLTHSGCKVCRERKTNRYPQFRIEGFGRKRGSRLVLTKKLGRSILPGKYALHSCDNPACLNPEHIWEGSQRENVQDMFTKGRQNRASGERHGLRVHPEARAFRLKNGAFTHPEKVNRGEIHGCVKLDEDSVRLIRSRYKKGGITQIRLSKEYGVSQAQISLIIRELNWTHI